MTKCFTSCFKKKVFEMHIIKGKELENLNRLSAELFSLFSDSMLLEKSFPVDDVWVDCEPYDISICGVGDSLVILVKYKVVNITKKKT